MLKLSLQCIQSLTQTSYMYVSALINTMFGTLHHLICIVYNIAMCMVIPVAILIKNSFCNATTRKQNSLFLDTNKHKAIQAQAEAHYQKCLCGT